VIHVPKSSVSCGHVTAVGGSRATVRLECTPLTSVIDVLSVGSLVEIQGQKSFAVAVVTAVSEKHSADMSEIIAEVDLLGEILRSPAENRFFQRGISEYPAIRSSVNALSNDHLHLIHDIDAAHTINIGTLSQDSSIGAFVNVDEMLSKHFAILGTTGVGKSSGVALILREIIEARPQQRVFLIDPHNEYGQCFGSKSHVLSPNNLHLPFWLFNFEEIVDAIFRARPGVEEEIEILAQAIMEAKSIYAEQRDASRLRLRKTGGDGSGYTVDTPVPYRLADLLKLIDNRMGKLENRSDFPSYHRLMSRIESLSNDPRYRFMFERANVGGDTMADTLSTLFNLNDDSRTVTVMQLAGFPSDVVDSVVSVLCRMAFDFGVWSGGAMPLLIVCEEAHRYAPSDRGKGFGPTKKSISRIAKEGRKYGISLGLVTQRPADLDSTIVSQCSTLFAMRMANDRDQAIVKSAVSDAAAALLSFLPALGTREVFAFGEGVAMPTRIRFAELPREFLPSAFTSGSVRSQSGALARSAVAEVVERWRRGGISNRHVTPYSSDLEDEVGLGVARPDIPPVISDVRPTGEALLARSRPWSDLAEDFRR
jgi:DNA helicase HerA-like ATPase